MKKQKRKQNYGSRILALMLAVCMLFTMMPSVAFAQELPGSEPPAAEEPAGQQPGAEEPGAEPGNEPGEEPGDGDSGQQPGADDPGTEEPGAEEPGEDPVVDSDGYESYFDKTAAAVQVGEVLELTLSFLYEGENGQMLPSTLGGATITINGAATEYKTDSIGKVSLTFTEPGTYNVSATGENIEFQAPLCVVTVSAKEEPVVVVSEDLGDVIGQVKVIVENSLYSTADGAPWDGQLINEWVNLYEGSSAGSCLIDALGDEHSQSGAENNFVGEIDGLAAFAAGVSSGWMVTLNDWFTSYGVDELTAASGLLESGDEIKFAYSVIGYGADLGSDWSNNNKSVSALQISKGTLAPIFDSAVKEYSLTVPEETTSVVITPTAYNKNFQIRASVNGIEYKRTDAIPIKDGTVITVTCGDPTWPSMNNGELGNGAEDVPAEVYTITVDVEEPEPVIIYTGSDWPSSSYHVAKLTLAGAKVDYMEGMHIYLNSKTAKNAEVTLEVTSGGRSPGNLGINWNDISTNTKTYTTNLVDGEATIKIRAYKASGAGASREGTKTFYLHTAAANSLPELANGVSSESEEAMTAGHTFELNLSEIFYDADGDELTYYVSEDGGTAKIADENWNTTLASKGTYSFVFTATDNKGTSTASYTLILSVEDSAETYTMTVHVPADLNPEFSILDKDNNKTVLTAEESEAKGDLAAWNVSYPTNAKSIIASVDGWGSVEFASGEDGIVQLRQVKIGGIDFEEKEITVSSAVTCDGLDVIQAKGSGNHYVLVTGKTYTYTVTPADTTKYVVKTLPAEELEASAETYVVTAEIAYNKSFIVTVPTGAIAKVYKYKQYYAFNDAELYTARENQDGTTTYYFQADSKKENLVYRVSMDGKVTKAGYAGWNTTDVTIKWDDTEEEIIENAGLADESVLLNINARNNLVLSEGKSATLKGYRAWEIIKTQTDNHIITPDFHFNILQGNDVINLEDKVSPSAGEGDWKTVKAVKEGLAIVEVSYDPILISGSSWDGMYGATDSARTGLAVIQVGGHDETIHFGIQGKASMGSVVYENSTPKAWDAEFDTLYFTGDSGTLKLKPTASSAITEVAVSNDKGSSWKPLEGSEGIYTAKIVSGNNILRVTTEAGSSYQVVRGDKVTVSVQEKEGASNGNGLIDAGETVRVTIEGLHTPIPKMAGNYNPGYAGNTDGKSTVHMSYTYNGATVEGAGSQYDFAVKSNYLEVTIPENYAEKTISLTDGYIGVGVIGLTTFTADEGKKHGDSHRNIPDGGCATRGNKTTFHTRSMLPEITITIGEAAAANNPPTVKGDAVKEASLALGLNYKINPETIFEDKDGHTLTYTVSINGGEAEAATANFSFTPGAEGTYTLTFTATDGRENSETAVHTITLIVTKKEDTKPTGPDYGLTEDQIRGYVSVSFEDFAERKEGEKGLKYPTPLGAIISDSQVPYTDGDTVADVTIRMLNAFGIGASYSGTTKSGFYLGAINNFVVNNTPYDSMGEFDAGSGSGWMITLNTTFIDRGASDFTVKNGDYIRWQYTCQLGKDIGDPFYDDKKDEVDKVTTGAASSGTGTSTTTPTQVTVSNDKKTATATITGENVTETLKQAAENKATEIVLQVSSGDTMGAAAIQVQLNTSTVKDILEDTAADLTVKTENGSVTLDRETLKTVTEEAKGYTVTLEVTRVDNPTPVQKEAAGEKGHIIQLTIKSGTNTISDFKAGKATVTVAVPTGLQGRKVAAIHIADDGTVTRLEGETLEIGGKKHHRFHTPHFSTFALIDMGPEKEEEPVKLTDEEVKELAAQLTPVARSVKTPKKNIKVTLKMDDKDQKILTKIQDSGYTVKYNFHRSDWKKSGYKSMLTKKTAVYTNTRGGSGNLYYYRATLEIYDAEGNLTCTTDLMQCKYAKRVWTK